MGNSTVKSSLAGLNLKFRRRAMRLVKSNVATEQAYRTVRRLTVRNQSRFINIYYCCLQKTGSQWLRAVLDDPIVYRRCGLGMVPFVALGLNTVSAVQAFPPRTIAAHLYLNYATYRDIPKPGRYRTFFVMRDPRDAVVSWYYSAKFSHRANPTMSELRSEFHDMDVKTGMVYLIDRLQEWGYFDAERSWVREAASDPAVRLMRYEHLATDPREFLQQLFEWLEIPVGEVALGHLLHRHRFDAYAEGRSKGDEDVYSHYRRGTPGEWQERFDQDVLSHFTSATGDLVSSLGYND